MADFAKVELIANKVVIMRIRAVKVSDIQFILKLSHQINRQHHQGAPTVFSSPEEADSGSEAYWLGLMLEPEGYFLVAEQDEQVVAFLAGKISFTDISRINQQVTHGVESVAIKTLEDVMELDKQARCYAQEKVGHH